MKRVQNYTRQGTSASIYNFAGSMFSYVYYGPNLTFYKAVPVSIHRIHHKKSSLSVRFLCHASSPLFTLF